MKLTSKSGAVLGALVVAALVAASAASLQVGSVGLGADTEVVAACDNDGILVEYETDYVVATQRYSVTGVRLLGLDDACASQRVSLVLGGADDTNTPADVDTDPDVLIEETELLIVLADLDSIDTDLDNGLVEDFLVPLTTPIDAVAIVNIAVVIA